MEVECISLVLGSDLRFTEMGEDPTTAVKCVMSSMLANVSFSDVYIPILCPREVLRGKALALSSDVRFPEWGSAQNPPPPPRLTDIKNINNSRL